MMNRMLKLFSLVGLLLVLAACANKLKIKELEGSAKALQNFPTFAWTSEPMVDSQVFPERTLLFDQSVRREVERQLNKRGFTQVTADQATMLVDYRVNMQTETAYVESNQDPMAYWQRDQYGNMMFGGWSDANGVVEMYQRGLLALTFVEQPSKQHIFQTTATKIVDGDQDIKQMESLVKKVVSRLLAGVPAAKVAN